MSKLNSLVDLLHEEVKDLFSAETQLVKALPKMAEAAASPALRDAFETQLQETRSHVERLEEAAKLLEVTPRGKTCKAMNGLVEESEETMHQSGEPAIKDLALITAAQKVEHYEIAGYGSARSLAERLGLNRVVNLFQATLNEIGNTEKMFTKLATQINRSVGSPMQA